MVLIKEECVGLAGNKLKGKRGGWRKWEGEEEEANTDGLILNALRGLQSNFALHKQRYAKFSCRNRVMT